MFQRPYTTNIPSAASAATTRLEVLIAVHGWNPVASTRLKKSSLTDEGSAVRRGAAGAGVRARRGSVFHDALRPAPLKTPLCSAAAPPCTASVVCVHGTCSGNACVCDPGYSVRKGRATGTSLFSQPAHRAPTARCGKHLLSWVRR